MRKLISNTAFKVGFVAAILIFIFLNYLSFVSNECSEWIDDCGWSFGFPFNLYMEGGFISFKEILWLGLIADIFIAITFSFALGLVFRFVWSKIAPRKLR
jgi:hypothetical protein